MATYFLSTSPTIANFDTSFNSPDNFVIDTTSAALVTVNQVGGSVTISDGTNTATFQNFAVGQISFPQFTASDGSQLLVADQTSGLANDDIGNNLAGGAGNDQLIGLGGADTLDGGAASDLIYGNQGADQITGSAGNDTVFGGQDADFINYGASAGDELIYGNKGNDTITGGTGADSLFGGQGNDSIIVNSTAGASVEGGLGVDSILGGAGNDTISGGDGFDTIQGGAGQNLIYGNQGGDIITGAATSNDTVFGGQGSDSINYAALGAGDVSLIYGNLGGDSIIGGAGKDTVFGGQGNDTIIGGLGSDTLSGNLGNDTFRFTATGTGSTSDSGTTTATADTITDFVTGVDTIQINNTVPAPDNVEAGTPNNYVEFADSSVNTVEKAITAHDNQINLGGADTQYTFVAGKTDGYLVIDATVGGAVDSVIVLKGQNSLADFDFTDITSVNGR